MVEIAVQRDDVLGQFLEEGGPELFEESISLHARFAFR